jgi:pilus assembly protein CpaE
MTESRKQVNILVVSRDVTLKPELDAAMEGASAIGAMVYFVSDYKQGLEAARAGMPQVICIEAGSNSEAVKSFAKDVLAIAPLSLLAAIYHQQDFPGGQTESRFVVEALRAGVQDFLRRPLSSGELQHLLTRLRQRGSGDEPQRGKIVSFISNRGGAGKSTLAINCAVGLAARHPDRVLLVDASLQLGVCATMLDLTPEVSIADIERERDRLDETFLHQVTAVHPSGLRLLAAPAHPVQAAEVTEETLTRVLGLARRSFDFIVVDTFPMLDGLVMTILDLTDLAYVVIQGAVPAVKGMTGLLTLLENLNYPAERQRLVVNRNFETFVGDLSVADIRDALAKEIHHVVVYERGLLLAANIGKPFLLQSSPKSPFAQAVMGIIDEIDGGRWNHAPAIAGDFGWGGRFIKWFRGARSGVGNGQ